VLEGHRPRLDLALACSHHRSQRCVHSADGRHLRADLRIHDLQARSPRGSSARSACCSACIPSICCRSIMPASPLMLVGIRASHHRSLQPDRRDRPRKGSSPLCWARLYAVQGRSAPATRCPGGSSAQPVAVFVVFLPCRARRASPRRHRGRSGIGAQAMHGLSAEGAQTGPGRWVSRVHQWRAMASAPAAPRRFKSGETVEVANHRSI